ncbi:unnamed protein product [Owenia fusiformis]|uniref:Major facilitator superfamily (MFS) profile domain-containing protein n=1 Tax=Owenia fusiformis TaxID=6347 RepID=A0A8S4PH93_OWEFU|nr:unnamed protein product [Owenia fusiformis]
MGCQKCTTRIASCFRSITVEPVLFLYMLAQFTQFSVFQQFLYRKTCFDKYKDIGICTNLTNPEYKEQEKYTQTEASHWIFYGTLCLTIPSLISASFIGSWADRFSRKLPILLPIIGACLSSLNYIILSVHMETVPLPLVLVSSTINGIMGGFVTAIMSVFSYVGFIADPRTRTIRIGILESMTFMGSTLGVLVSGIMLENTSFTFVFSFLLVSQVLACIYTLIFVKDIKPTEDQRQGKNYCSFLFSLSHLKSSVMCVFKPRERQRRLHLLLTLLAVFFTLIVSIGFEEIALLYTKHPPLSWRGIKLYGYFKALMNGLQGLALIAILPIAKKCTDIHDTSVILFGALSKIGGLVLFGFSKYTWMVFLVAPLAMFQSFTVAGMRALMSKLVEPNEQGKMFAIVGIGESLCTLLGSTIFNNLYPATLKFYPGFSFFAAAGMMLIPIILIVWVRQDMKSQAQYESLQVAGGICPDPLPNDTELTDSSEVLDSLSPDQT